MAKNNNKNKKIKAEHTKVMNSINKRDTEVSTVVKCVIVVLVVIGLIYLLTVYITKHSTDSVKKVTREDTEIQYDEILAGTSFSKEDDEYLVMFYDVANDTDSIYSTLKSDYESKEDAIPIYYVDLGSSLNKQCLNNESNSKATKSSELKINDTTLIKFSNKKIVDYIVGKEDITNYLK